MAKKPRHETGAVDVSTEALREQIAGCLLTARERTQLLTGCLDDGDLVRQHSPLMSPLVWDLAHVANQEELWLLRAVGGRDPMHPEIDPLYDAFEHPRAERPRLPLLPPATSRESESRGDLLRYFAEAIVDDPDGRPLLLLVDDAQDLDDASAALLLHLVVHGGVFPVVTVRTGEPAPESVVMLWKDELLERALFPDSDPFHEPDIFGVFWSAAGRADLMTGHVKEKRTRLGGQG